MYIAPMARLFPRDLLEFERKFRTEDDCRRYLAKIRWPYGFRCPQCGLDRAWRIGDKLWQCQNCNAMVSITAGTIFHRSHLPLRLWFRAIWWFTNQKTGVSALGMQHTLGLGSYHSAWACLHKLRRAMVRPNREHLTTAVEVDDIFVGGRTHVPGRTPGSKAVVVVAVEIRGEGMGRVRLKQIPEPTKEHLVHFVKEVVAPGAVVITDGWESYNGVARQGYIHQPRTIHKTGRTGSQVLPRVHRVAALLKRWLLGVYQGRVSWDHLDHYLEEFAFRFNRRSSRHRGQLFYRLLQQAVAVEPHPYQVLKRQNVSQPMAPSRST